MAIDPTKQIAAKNVLDIMKSTYISETDPANDSINGVLASKRWTQINSQAQIIGEKVRNLSNTGWLDVPIGGVSEGDKGDIIVSNTSGWSIKALAVTSAKLGGDISAAGKTLLTAADVAAQRSALNLNQVPNVDARDRTTHTGTQSIATINGITATRLLGRYSAGFGVAQEISLSSDFSLAGGVLQYVGQTGSGGITAVATNNTTTIALTGQGTSTSNLLAALKISAQSGNALSVLSDGLFAVQSTESFATLKTKLGFTTRHLSEFSSFAAAVTAIGSSVTELIIDDVYTLSANVTTHTNTLVNFRGSGFIWVNSGYTLSIGRMQQVGNWQVFGGAGNKLFGKSAVEYINLAWYVGTAANTDATAALSNIITTLTNNEGGKAFVPDCLYTTSGGHNIPSNSHIFGVTGSTFGDKGSQIKLTGENSYVFKIGENLRNIRLSDLTIHCGATTNSKGILANGRYPYSTYNCSFERIVIIGGLICFDVKSDPSAIAGKTDPWEFINITFTDCQFLFGRSGFKCNTINSGFTFSGFCYVIIPGANAANAVPHYSQGGIGWELLSVGTLIIENGVVISDGQLTGSTIVYQEGAYNRIKITLQDESVHYCFRNGYNSFAGRPIKWSAGTIQSIFRFNADADVEFEGCTINADNGKVMITNDASAKVNIHLIGKNVVADRGTGVEVLKPFESICSFGYSGGNALSNYNRIHYPDGSINPQQNNEQGSPGANPYIISNSSRGTITLPAGSVNVRIYNNLIAPDTLVEAYLRTNDANGIFVKSRVCGNSQCDLIFSGASAGEISVGWEIRTNV